MSWSGCASKLLLLRICDGRMSSSRHAWLELYQTVTNPTVGLAVTWTCLLLNVACIVTQLFQQIDRMKSTCTKISTTE